jgi:hypothetical protein
MKNIKLTKKDKQKIVTKHFMEVIEMEYGLVSSDEGDSGTIDFTIDVEDSEGRNFEFNYRRSYQDVLSWKMAGGIDYDQSVELEQEMNEILSKIIAEVENN